MDTPLILELAGRALVVSIKRSGTARRMSLRLDPAGRGVVVVLPVGVPECEALRFARSQREWIAGRLDSLPEWVPFVPGTSLPLLGQPVAIHHRPDARRGAWVEDGALNVCGQADHVPRRVRDFLLAEARRQIVPRAHAHAQAIGRAVTRISLRDTRSRWGSCTAGGELAFSWRLVMAPERVLSYVVAHEVAHLAELNHSARFWAVVAGLVGDAREPRHWLKANGAGLHRYG